MERIAILGAGDLGESLFMYLRDRGDTTCVGFLDDARHAAGGADGFLGLPLIGGAADAPNLYKKRAFDRLVYAIGYRNFAVRRRIFTELKGAGVPFRGVVHPTAYVHPSAAVGEGVHLFPATVIDMAAVLGDNIVLNTGCIIAHHSIIGDHCYFGPGARVAGIVHIESCCFVGIGSSIVEKVRIGTGSVIAAGAVVTDNVEPQSLMAGVPAICKKRLDS